MNTPNWIKAASKEILDNLSSSNKTSDVISMVEDVIARHVTKEDIKSSWINGFPKHPWDKEWFIAETIWGDRVVLKALPKEYSYDFKTADETYIKADKIKRWMQFPDSNYIVPSDYPKITTPYSTKQWQVSTDSIDGIEGKCETCKGQGTLVHPFSLLGMVSMYCHRCFGTGKAKLS